MRILYSAIDQRVPGTTGGSVHVEAVASGLAARGHEVHVLAGAGEGGFPAGAVRWHAVTPPFGARQLRLLRARTVRDLARRLSPDVIIERYYNFGGESVRAAAGTGARLVLEVNAPIVDYPGSAKAAVDRAAVVRPMRRWREWQCRAADLIVTPTARIVPDWVPPDRVLEIEWGADVERFRPDASGPVPFSREAGEALAIFAGAFRSWHGAIDLVRAIRTLEAHGPTPWKAILVGDGPERPRAMELAAGSPRLVFTGALPHDRLPACLAAADVGVAPFDTNAHAPLALEFYWSPLKIFEYMAAGLPVVAPDIPRIGRLVASGREGILYDRRAADALAGALGQLVDPAVRRRLGAAARQRVVADFSWSAHCAALERAFERLLAPGRTPRPAALTRP
jgi:glycosyltransferase involved in cell wall biosynthesis